MRSKYSSSSFVPPLPFPISFSLRMNSIRSIHFTILYPKIKDGGLLAGHDYIEDGINAHGDFGVRKAVGEFSAKHQINIYQTAEPFPSWMTQKPMSAGNPAIRLDDLFQFMETNNLFLKRRISKLEREVQLLKVGNLRFFLRQPKKFVQSLLERSHEQF